MFSASVLSAVFLLTTCAFAQYEWPTLKEELAKQGIPASGLPAEALDQKITSYATYKDSSRFAIGYYYLQKDNLLHPPLWLRVYDESQDRWSVRKYEPSERASSGDLDDNCFGSVLSIQIVAKQFVIETHINPSAECTILLRENLSVQRVLGGWIVAASGGSALIELNTVHFAPTHPLTLSLYEPAPDRLTKLFPPKDDATIASYERELKNNLSEDWCRANDAPCAPDDFESELGKSSFNASTMTIAAEVSFSPVGFGPKAEKKVGQEDYVYIFHRQNDTWKHRALRTEDVHRSLEELTEKESVANLFSGK